MLNPGFTVEAEEAYGSRYVVPAELSEAIVAANSDYATGPELRTQAVYGDELWSRIADLGLADLHWAELDVLDACCGTGLLSYHLLDRASPGSLTLLDVSAAEVEAAERLIAGDGRAAGDVRFAVGDLAADVLGGERFDVVAGNSFLHHFPSVPDVLASIHGLLRPGGLFLGLHEPTPAALAWESGDPRQVAAYFLARRRYLRGTRHGGPGPVRDGTTDVWIFEPRELRDLLTAQGFTDIRIVPRYLARPFLVGALRLHLSDARPRLTPREERLLRASVRLDSFLRRVLPAGAFGGVSIAARRPA